MENNQTLDDETIIKIEECLCKIALCYLLLDVGAIQRKDPFDDKDFKESINWWCKHVIEVLLNLFEYVDPKEYIDLKKLILILNCYKKSCLKTKKTDKEQIFGLYIPTRLKFDAKNSDNSSSNKHQLKRYTEQFLEIYKHYGKTYVERFFEKQINYLEFIRPIINPEHVFKSVILEKTGQKTGQITQEEFLNTILKSISDTIEAQKISDTIEAQKISDTIEKLTKTFNLDVKDNVNDNIYPIDVKHGFNLIPVSTEKETYVWYKEFEFLFLFMYAIDFTWYSIQDIFIFNSSDMRDKFYSDLKKKIIEDFFVVYNTPYPKQAPVNKSNISNKSNNVDSTGVVSGCIEFVCRLGECVCKVASAIASGGTRKKHRKTITKKHRNLRKTKSITKYTNKKN